MAGKVQHLLCNYQFGVVAEVKIGNVHSSKLYSSSLVNARDGDTRMIQLRSIDSLSSLEVPH